MTIRITRTKIIVTTILAMLVFAAVALAGKPDWYSNMEKTTDNIAKTAASSTPYPSDQMHHFLERDNLRRRLIAFNNPNKIGYLYITTYGKFVGYYTIKGKVSSVNSQMTVTDQTWDSGSGADTVAASLGDDGSFGPNEGGDRGVFFFTTTGTMVETTLDWVYSDKPLKIDVPNLVK